MNRFSRSLSAFLAFSLFLAAPGLAPYQAAAQTIGARAVPAGQAGSVGASINGLRAPAFALPSASLRTGLIPTLSPSAALAPALTAPAPAAAAAPASAAVPLLQRAALPVRAAPVRAAAPASAIAALESGSSALRVSAKSASADAPRAALDGLFEGSAARPEALAVSGRLAVSDSPRLRAPSAREPSAGPRWVKSLRAPSGSAPATSLKRTLSVGFLAAVVPIAITMVTVVVAQLLGYQLHPNYEGPGGAAAMTVLQALAVWVGAAVMAPVSEEAIFRAGLQARLGKLAAKLRLGSFVVPAVVTSLIFVALHETADPVLFATRFVHAMILGYVYHKEGLLAAMAAHGFFNGLLALSIVAAALGAPWLAIAAVPAALVIALRAAKVIRAQKPDVASGKLKPLPMSGLVSIALAAILVAGYLMLSPNIFWAIGAVALLINGIVKLKNKTA